MLCSKFKKLLRVLATRLHNRQTNSMIKAKKASSREIEATYRVSPGLYLIGSLERGVTIYNQQVRAHNLAWVLWKNGDHRKVSNIAVVGGGIAGLTMAASLLSLFGQRVSISLFEKSWDLCPFQQGADVRWVHPRIYNWPDEGSRAPSASLPVLDWTEGRASDVARRIMSEFSKFADSFARPNGGLSIYLGLQHFQIEPNTRSISWIGYKASRENEFFHLGKPEGTSAQFDAIVLATGFGTETVEPEYRTESYWRNEQLAQPPLDRVERRYLVSGFGDGALIDVCRLTVERFRQDTIIYELFQDDDLENVERLLWAANRRAGAKANLFSLFQRDETTLLRNAKSRLEKRIRKDTQVILHLSGRNKEIKHFEQIFGLYSSFLNRLLIYLLYRCGAFALDFSELNDAVRRHQVASNCVICRYGANTSEHLLSSFVNGSVVARRLTKMKEMQIQSPQRLWTPGIFRHYSST